MLAVVLAVAFVNCRCVGCVVGWFVWYWVSCLHRLCLGAVEYRAWFLPQFTRFV